MCSVCLVHGLLLFLCFAFSIPLKMFIQLFLFLICNQLHTGHRTQDKAFYVGSSLWIIRSNSCLKKIYFEIFYCFKPPKTFKSSFSRSSFQHVRYFVAKPGPKSSLPTARINYFMAKHLFNSCILPCKFPNKSFQIKKILCPEGFGRS